MLHRTQRLVSWCLSVKSLRVTPHQSFCFSRAHLLGADGLAILPVLLACCKDLNICLLKCKGCRTMTASHILRVACPDLQQVHAENGHAEGHEPGTLTGDPQTTSIQRLNRSLWSERTTSTAMNGALEPARPVQAILSLTMWRQWHTDSAVSLITQSGWLSPRGEQYKGEEASVM